MVLPSPTDVLHQSRMSALHAAGGAQASLSSCPGSVPSGRRDGLVIRELRGLHAPRRRGEIDAKRHNREQGETGEGGKFLMDSGGKSNKKESRTFTKRVHFRPHFALSRAGRVDVFIHQARSAVGPASACSRSLRAGAEAFAADPTRKGHVGIRGNGQ